MGIIFIYIIVAVSVGISRYIKGIQTMRIWTFFIFVSTCADSQSAIGGETDCGTKVSLRTGAANSINQLPSCVLTLEYLDGTSVGTIVTFIDCRGIYIILYCGTLPARCSDGQYIMAIKS